MGAQHTPGPWTADGNGIHAGTSCVATTHREPREQRAADARLIAAAPELLVALGEYLVLGTGKCSIGRATADKALAAVRKATGEA